jgi:hypothetical protein
MSRASLYFPRAKYLLPLSRYRRFAASGLRLQAERAAIAANTIQIVAVERKRIENSSALSTLFQDTSAAKGFAGSDPPPRPGNGTSIAF